MENGLDAHAITEHGNMSSYAHAQLWIEEWNKSNKDKHFKYIPGVEAYYHPDLEVWRADKEREEQAQVDKKAAAKLAKQQEKLQTKIVSIVDSNDEDEDIETTNALVLENEDESKSTKHFNPVNRRHHLILLPKNQKGLLAIFGACSQAYLKGFYRFPRIDFKLLRAAASEGNIVATSACLHPQSQLVTDHGSMSIVELVGRVERGEAIKTLSYDIGKRKLEFKLVSWGSCTRRGAKLLRVKLKNGQILRLTPDHQVYTSQGWVEAQYLTKTHRVLSVHHSMGMLRIQRRPCGRLRVSCNHSVGNRSEEKGIWMTTCPDFVEIDTIELDEETSDVYDITVDETHNFFAEGMLVHNCIGGLPAYSVFQELQQHKFEELSDKLLDDPIMLDRCVNAVANCYDHMVEAVGKGNYYLELQFNRLPAQNLVNRSIIEFVRRTGQTSQLIVTGDAHYYRPELWKDRELYKRLGWMGYQIEPDSLPKSKDELKCELYPKNAQQMWQEYQRSKEGTTYYDDDLVADAIERTHDIAHQVIGEVPPDRSPKFPTRLLIPEGTSSFNHLVSLCKEGIVKRGLQDKPEYVERLKEELGVIKTMKNEVYFISYQKIMELARKVCLCGPGRGCFTPETRVLLADGTHATIGTIKVGDMVKDADGKEQKVLEVFRYKVDEDILELEFDDGCKVKCTKDHKFLTKNRGWVEAQDLTEDDELVEVKGQRWIDASPLTW